MQRWWRYAYEQPAVFVVTAPGSVPLRWELQRSLRRLGWPQVPSPAGADVLAVVGRSDDAWRATVARVWDQLPGPRARIDVLTPEAVEGALDGARTALLDRSERQDDERARMSPVAGPGGDMAVMDHGGDMAGMDMPMPGGLPEASRGPDRDGLQLDVLTLQVGPALPDWPAGLVLRLAIQGDVVQHGEGWVHARDTTAQVTPSPTNPVAEHLDVAATVLRLAGDARRAAQIERVLQDALVGADVSGCVQALVRDVRRSRLLRWQLAGVGVAGPDVGADAPAGSDAWDRLLLRLAAAQAGHPCAAPPSPTQLVKLVVGAEVADARLAVASTAPTDMAGVHAVV